MAAENRARWNRNKQAAPQALSRQVSALLELAKDENARYACNRGDDFVPGTKNSW